MGNRDRYSKSREGSIRKTDKAETGREIWMGSLLKERRELGENWVVRREAGVRRGEGESGELREWTTGERGERVR